MATLAILAAVLMIAATLTITQTASRSGSQVTNSTEYTAGLLKSLSESVPDSSSDLAIVFELDVSATKAFYIVSDQDITIETNDGTTPDDTLSLSAGIPYVWTVDSYDSFLLTTDVTALYATNSSGSDATLQIEAVTDPTP